MSEQVINLTEKAITECKKIMAEQGFTPEAYVLEAAVTGGGCSGFQYKLSFKEKTEFNDKIEDLLEFDGLSVAVSKRAQLYIQGTTIDFHDDLNKRGFSFNNPNATGKCGCGSSFTV